MKAYRGLVKDGKVIFAEGVSLPEGAVVTVTIGEAEHIRATLQNRLKRNVRRRVKARLPKLGEKLGKQKNGLKDGLKDGLGVAALERV